jgi:hypothetical protein
MRFQLTISLDNADARYEDGSLSYDATAGYLEQAARKVQVGLLSDTIRDSNGNTIGQYTTTDED